MSRFTIEARSVDSQTNNNNTPTKTVQIQPPDPFPYGWRYVISDDEQTYKQIPLTAEDLLDPQLGDQVVQNSKHQRANNEIFDMLDNHYDDDPMTEVFSDLKMRWGISGLKEPAPDIAIVQNLKDKGAVRPSFDVVKEGTSPCLVIEMMSEGYPGDDTEKLDIYERAGVKEYIIINPHTTTLEPYYEMWGYRLTSEGKYRRIKPNKQGRLLSETTKILFGIYKKGRRLKLKDALTGKWLMTASGEKAGRLKAETKIQAEAKARQKAEAKMQAEAKARQKAEARAQWLEQRLRELEAKS